MSDTQGWQITHIIESLDQVREATHSQDQEMAELNVRVANIEHLLEKLNATMHEGVNGKEPLMTRIALNEEAVNRISQHVRHSPELALIKGKWRALAVMGPGALALVGEAVHWFTKAG